MISAILLALAAFFNATMDVISTRYDKSIFKGIKNQQFWDWRISWKNKWKNGDSTQGEKFFLASSMFSFMTDSWHLAKGLMIILISSAIVFYKPIFGILDIVLFNCIWGVVFEACYGKILIKK
jgi:hypothetical protein